MATRSISSRSLASQESIQFMRAINIRLSLTDARPNTLMYVFFDGQYVGDYCRMPGNPVGSPIISDKAGRTVIDFSLPAGKFTTGTKDIIVADTSNLQALESAGSVFGAARGTFTSSGMTNYFQTTTTNITTVTQENVVIREVPAVAPTPPAPVVTPIRDPIAQSFFTYGVTGGLFLTSIDLYFQTKDPEVPVRVELRQMVNGYPSPMETNNSGLIASVLASNVNVSNNASVPTKFTFPAPLYLKEDSDYCFVIFSNSSAYNIFTSKLGEFSIETGSKIFEQPYVGSMFKSENNVTWQSEQFEDVKFTLNKAVFSSTAASLNFAVNPPQLAAFGDQFKTVAGSNLVSYTHKQQHGLEIGSKINISCNSAGVYNGIPGTELNGTFNVVGVTSRNTVTFQTVSNATSTGTFESCGLIREIHIDSGGTNYPANTSISLVSTTGTGAVVTPQIVNGKIHAVTISNPGSGYLTAPSVVITGVGGSGAVLVPVVYPAFAVSVNKPMVAFRPNITNRAFQDTKLTSKVRTTIGNYEGGNLNSYTAGKTVDFTPNDRFFNLNQNSLVVSRFNESALMGNSVSTQVTIGMSSANPNLSPMIDLNRVPELQTYSTKINNQPGETLTSTAASGGVLSIAVTAVGTGYTAIPSVVITGNGTGATAHATLTGTSLNTIVVDTAGTGYTEVPTVTIVRNVADTTGSGGAGQATLTSFNTEVSTGGRAASKYITRKTTLQTISSGIRLFCVLASTTDSSVDWYIRTSLSGSNNPHEQSSWTRLNCDIPRNKSDSNGSQFEYEFKLDGLAPFDTYDLKCVLLAQDPTKSPTVYSYRSIIVA